MYYKKIITFYSLFILFIINTSCSILNKIIYIQNIDIFEKKSVSIYNVKKIKIGMTKDQIKNILKNPKIKNILNNDIWNYFIHIKLKNIVIRKKVILFFRNNILIKISYSDIKIINK